MGGNIYFVTDGEAIKIGYSGAPLLRIKDLQTSHHQALELMGTIPGSVETEQALHKRFEHLLIRGEWFRAEPDLLAFIDGIPRPYPGPLKPLDPVECKATKETIRAFRKNLPKTSAIYHRCNLVVEMIDNLALASINGDVERATALSNNLRKNYAWLAEHRNDPVHQ